MLMALIQNAGIMVIVMITRWRKMNERTTTCCLGTPHPGGSCCGTGTVCSLFPARSS
jgi:hypothetical protein